MTSTGTAPTKSPQSIKMIDALQGELLIRSADGSEVALEGCTIGPHYCSTKRARLRMAEETRWDVPEVEEPTTEGRFSSDTEVRVGEPFGMLFYYPEHDRRVWISLGRVKNFKTSPLLAS
jgi:hypothetical protein